MIGIGQRYIVGSREINRLDTFHQGGNMLGRCRESFDSYDTFQNGVGLRVLRRCRNNTGAVDEIYPLREGDVLPDLLSKMSMTTFESFKVYL